MPKAHVPDTDSSKSKKRAQDDDTVDYIGYLLWISFFG